MGDTCTETTIATITDVHDHDGTTVIGVAGEIDIACADPLRAAITTHLDRRPAGFVLDLTRVDFFGSAGVQLLVEAVVRAQRLGVALAVATDRRAVLRPLEITLVTRMVDIHPSRQDALDAVRADAVPVRQRVSHH